MLNVNKLYKMNFTQLLYIPDPTSPFDVLEIRLKYYLYKILGNFSNEKNSRWIYLLKNICGILSYVFTLTLHWHYMSSFNLRKIKDAEHRERRNFLQSSAYSIYNTFYPSIRYGNWFLKQRSIFAMQKLYCMHFG